MKRRFFLFLALFFVVLAGCAPQKGDWFAPFRDAFIADVEGTWNGIAFSAQVCADAPNEEGARGMTLTFYAPQTLCGTKLSCDERGDLSLSSAGLSLPLAEKAAQGYGALLALFPVAGEVKEITREDGNTRLTGAGFSLLFSADGTPLAAQNAVASVEIVKWGS